MKVVDIEVKRSDLKYLRIISKTQPGRPVLVRTLILSLEILQKVTTLPKLVYRAAF